MANGVLSVGDYKYGFSVPQKPVFRAKKGLSRRIVEEISWLKNEPSWMRQKRLRALEIFLAKKMPTWGADLSEINFDEIYYYIKPTSKKSKTWDEVPAEIKYTFERLGIPEAERKFLAGVELQFDSETVYGSIKKNWEDKGVIFCDTDTALQKYPEIVAKYFGTIIPAADNKFASLNSAVWSGGSFVWVPKGIKVDIPLQAYFRINANQMGQFERTLIIAEEGSEVCYIEGCFTKDAKIWTNPDYKPIEEVKVGDKVLTHNGRYKTVYHTQVRPYKGNLYTIQIYSDPTAKIEVTDEHPFLYVKRTRRNERNKRFKKVWLTPKDFEKGDYLAIPINKAVKPQGSYQFEVKFKGQNIKIDVPSTKEFFRLVGYYLAEGSVAERGYLSFSFGIHEKEYVKDVKGLLRKVFGVKKFYDMVHKTNHGISVVVASAKLARIFKQFGTSASTKKIPQWMMLEDTEKQKELVVGFYRGDGNYYNKQNKWSLKELFRINTTSEILARQVKDTLLRLGIVAFINKRPRKKEGRQTIYTVGIGGEFMVRFGEIVGTKIKERINGHKRGSLFGIDKSFAYVPIKNIRKKFVEDIPVYNFSVEDDESYVANSVAVHNCTSPTYTTDSLHAAVVEIIVCPCAKVQYITVQNWSSNVYNLVTKRAFVQAEGEMLWIDANLGSKVTMKYPSFYLKGPKSKGETLSLAVAGAGQHQDAGSKAFHLAPETSSVITSKSVSYNGGRTSYRGLVKVVKNAEKSKSHVVCDALILDEASRSDTYPTMEIDEDNVSIAHEASVAKISGEQLFYLQSRGLTEAEARSAIVNGFISPIVKQIPLEYAVELNRLIALEMENAIG